MKQVFEDAPFCPVTKLPSTTTTSAYVASSKFNFDSKGDVAAAGASGIAVHNVRVFLTLNILRPRMQLTERCCGQSALSYTLALRVCLSSNSPKSKSSNPRSLLDITQKVDWCHRRSTTGNARETGPPKGRPIRRLSRISGAAENSLIGCRKKRPLPSESYSC